MLEGGSAADGLPLADWRASCRRAPRPPPPCARRRRGKRRPTCSVSPAGRDAGRRDPSGRAPARAVARAVADRPCPHAAGPVHRPRLVRVPGRIPVQPGSPACAAAGAPATGRGARWRNGVPRWSAQAGEQPAPPGWRPPPDQAGATAATAEHLLGAARAALFSLSLARGEPALLLDAERVAAEAGGAAAAVLERLEEGEEKRQENVSAMRETVLHMTENPHFSPQTSRLRGLGQLLQGADAALAARPSLRARPHRHLRRRFPDRRVPRPQPGRADAAARGRRRRDPRVGRDPALPRRGHAVSPHRPASSARTSTPGCSSSRTCSSRTSARRASGG